MKREAFLTIDVSRLEAAAALPLSGSANGTAVYDVLDWRRARFWQDEKVPLWTPKAG